MPSARPPAPGPIVSPNYLSLAEAVGDITFPISKRELVERVGDGTALFQGRNVDLSEVLGDLDDDYFDSEEELQGALERRYGALDDPDGGQLGTGSPESYQSTVGPGDTASPGSYLEPPE